MTREEAREFLIAISYALGNMSVEYLSEKDGEKMREAIKALEQEPTTKNDLVPRNIVERIIKSPRTKEQMLLVLNSLPSQEPNTKNDLGVDAISRQEAIDTIRQLYLDLASQKAVIDLLKVLPSVTPQEPKIVSIAENKCDIDKLKELMNKAPLTTVIPQEPQTFKWCTGCKEYDQEKHCCHRWSKVIRDTVEEMKQEQELIIDKIRAEIIKYEGDCRLSVDEYPSCKECTDNVFKTIYGILDKYKAESEDKE